MWCGGDGGGGVASVCVMGMKCGGHGEGLRLVLPS